MENKELIKIAIEYSKNSYCPYSNFMVGAAILTNQNKVIGGCNIENDGIMSICAERTAFVKAISENEKEFIKIAIVGKERKGKYIKTLPCGYCRQFMSEFCDEKFKIITYEEESGKIEEYTLGELLPNGFNR